MSRFCVFRAHPTEEVWVRLRDYATESSDARAATSWDADDAATAVELAAGSFRGRFFAVPEEALEFFDVSEEVERTVTVIVESAGERPPELVQAIRPRRWWHR